MLRQEVRVLPNMEGRSGTVCPDPGVVKGAGVGSLGTMDLSSPDAGHLLQRAGLHASSEERSQGMSSMCSQHWVLQG